MTERVRRRSSPSLMLSDGARSTSAGPCGVVDKQLLIRLGGVSPVIFKMVITELQACLPVVLGQQRALALHEAMVAGTVEVSFRTTHRERNADFQIPISRLLISFGTEVVLNTTKWKLDLMRANASVATTCALGSFYGPQTTTPGPPTHHAR